MTNLKKIPGIGNVTLELLKAAGFPDAESLAKAGVDELARELERANKILQISKRPLPRSNIEKWPVISPGRDGRSLRKNSKCRSTTSCRHK
jgi:nucleotidyltransferase/DNA polymerase involved in DNA repair